jgi:hypothetical protein
MISQIHSNKITRLLLVSLTLVAVCLSGCETCDKEASLYTLYPCRFNEYDPETHDSSFEDGRPSAYTLNNNDVIGVYTDFPDKVVVRVGSLDKFHWENVILPIGLAYKIDNPTEDGSTPKIAFFKDTATCDIFYFQLFHYQEFPKIAGFMPIISCNKRLK